MSEQVGAQPTLPPPDPSLIPVIDVVSAKGWTEGKRPDPIAGTSVNAFARDLEHPRWLYVLPNGDVLVAETNGPVRPDDNTSIKGRFVKRYQQKAGGAVPSANRITLLRDADGDGVAEVKTPFITNLTSPFGMALVGDTLYVADTDAILRFPYRAGETKLVADDVGNTVWRVAAIVAPASR